jgi:hypothetical protein
MESKNVIKDKSFAFAVRVVRTYQIPGRTKKGIYTVKTFASGTNVGAMLREK